MLLLSIAAAFTCLSASHRMNTVPPAPLSPVPSKRQINWYKNEFYAFVHFGPNTFTGNEWGSGKESEAVFNPTHLDCMQWCRAFKAAGMAGVIITAKHHDGFCLWPSKYSTHTVAQSPWKGGHGDVLRELSDACHATGLRFGVYLSPWDRNHPTYGTPEYNQTFEHMLGEVLGNYGKVFEVWFDGANGEGPNGKKQVYDWDGFHSVVRKLQPDACMFSDAGPDIRWVGNEAGHSAPTCWSTIDASRYHPGTNLSDELTEGAENGTDWVPAECDVSIRPGWFYKASEDNSVKTESQLENLYYASVGQNASFLLNVPAGPDGLIHQPDIDSLMALRKRLDATFKTDLARGKSVMASSVRGKDEAYGADKAIDGNPNTYWATDDGVTNGWLDIDLGKPTLLDRVLLQEYVALGQRVSKFSVEAKVDGAWQKLADGTTIGYKRILRVPAIYATEVRLNIEDAKACPTISTFALYASPDAKMDSQRETKAQKDARMAWFRQARFGMFIHWGLYAIPAGVWNGKEIPGAAEWLMNTAKVPVADYEPLMHQFNPVKFNAREWVRIAKDAGMKYIVITSKHHEGFNMFDSHESDYNIMNTPFHRDVLKELAQACKEEGIKLCFYHSIMDWHHPDYLPRRPWDPRPGVPAEFDKYVAYMKAELKELLTNYGPIGILWFDGEWENTWTHDRGKDLYYYIRSLQPNIIVNNRVDTGRNDMQGMSKSDEFYGDYGTPEQEIPPNGLPGVDWESCMTMNDTWGYSSHDHNWKSSETLIKNLVDIASKGGNYLLNVGPTSEGLIPQESVERLHVMGEWMKRNGEAVYGTQAGPFPKPLPWGRVTEKGNKLYLCVFQADNGEIDLPGFKADIKRAYALTNPSTAVTYAQGQDDLIVHVGDHNPDPVDVYVLELNGKPTVTAVPIMQAMDGTIELKAEDAEIHGATARVEGDKHAIGYWTNPSDWVSWKVRVKQPGRFSVSAEIACEPGSEGSTFSFEVGGSKISGKVPSTGSWTQFTTVPVGEIEIETGGDLEFSVRAASKPGVAVMNLRSIQLKLK